MTCGGTDHDGSCGQADLCVTRIIWERVNRAIEESVDSITLDQLVEESRERQRAGVVDRKECAN